MTVYYGAENNIMFTKVCDVVLLNNIDINIEQTVYQSTKTIIFFTYGSLRVIEEMQDSFISQCNID